MCTPEYLIGIFTDYYSQDPDKNTAANQAIAELHNQNIVDLLLACSSIVLQNDVDVKFATLAVNIISNVFRPSIVQSQTQIKEFWKNLGSESNEIIRNALIRGLMFNSPQIQSFSSKSLSRIFINCFPNDKERAGVFSLLQELFTNTEAYGQYAKYGVISIMNYIFEAKVFIVKSSEQYLSDAEIALNCCSEILQMNPPAPISEIALAFQCIYHCITNYLDRGTNLFQDGEKVSELFNLIFQYFPNHDINLHSTLYDLIFVMLKLNYIDAAPIFEQIFGVISVDFSSSDDAILQSCLNFWKAFCKYELSVLPQMEESPHYIAQVFQAIIECLLPWLAQDYEDIESRLDLTLFHKAVEARILIETFGKMLPEEVVKLVVDFINTKTALSDWPETISFLLGLQASLHIVGANFPDLLEYLEVIVSLKDHDHPAVRETALFILSEYIIVFHEQLKPQFNAFIEIALSTFSMSPIDAAVGCVLIRRILQFETFELQQYGELLQALFTVIDRPDIATLILPKKVTDCFRSIIEKIVYFDGGCAMFITAFQETVERLKNVQSIAGTEDYENIIYMLRVMINVLVDNSSHLTVKPDQYYQTCNEALGILAPLFNESQPSMYLLMSIFDIIKMGQDSCTDYYVQVLPIAVRIISSEDTTTGSLICHILSEVVGEKVFAEQTLPYCDNLFAFISNYAINDVATSQQVIAAMELAASLFSITQGNPMELLIQILDILKNFYDNLSLMTESDYPEFFNVTMRLCDTFVDAAKNVTNQKLINPSRARFMFKLLNLVEKMEKPPMSVYWHAIVFIRTCVYSPFMKTDFKVFLKQPYVGKFFTSQAYELYKQSNSDRLVTLAKSVATAIRNKV